MTETEAVLTEIAALLTEHARAAIERLPPELASEQARPETQPAESIRTPPP